MQVNTENIKFIDDDQASAEQLEINLLKSLKNLQTQSENKSFTLSVKDETDILIGGVTGRCEKLKRRLKKLTVTVHG